MILALLSAIAFAFVFILLAFVVPIKEEPVEFGKQVKPKHKLEAISESMKNR